MADLHGVAPEVEHPGVVHGFAQANEDPESLRLGARSLCLRELRTDDRAQIESLLTQVAAPDLQMRFFTAFRQVPPGLIDQLMHIDATQRVTMAAVLGGGLPIHRVRSSGSHVRTA